RGGAAPSLGGSRRGACAMTISAGGGHEAASPYHAMGPALPRSAHTYTFPNHTYTEATMATLVRKNVFLDPTTLKRAQAILGRRSESEAIREALEDRKSTRLNSSHE